MQKFISGMKGDRSGFTLIEVLIVVAIMGILAAILVPTLSGLLGRGEKAGLEGDVDAVSLAVKQFHLDLHKGPDSNHKWGEEGAARLYPTEDGEVGDVELNPDEEDPDHAGNLRVDKYKEGEGTNGAAEDSDISGALVWMGLLVNEPADDHDDGQKASGDVRPQGGEEGEYLPDFPKSAHADNTDKEGSGTGSYTSGSYRYIVLHNGEVCAAYKRAADGNWYCGYNGVYP